VLPALKSLLDKNESRSGWGHSYLKLLSGDPDGALALLAIDVRHQHATIWWILERDPQWAELRTIVLGRREARQLPTLSHGVVLRVRRGSRVTLLEAEFA
jgi:hypothetical protein